MILDKFNDFIYTKASPFFTRWRVGCFLLICMLLSEIVFDMLGASFWTGTVSHLTEVFSRIFEIPVIKMIGVFVLCFLLGPALSKYFSLLVIDLELKRASPVVDALVEKSRGVSQESLFMYRDRAVEGESSINRMVGLNESFIIFLLFGVFSSFSSGLMIYCYAIFFVSPFLLYFSVQNVLSNYLKTVLFYKLVAKELSERTKK